MNCVPVFERLHTTARFLGGERRGEGGEGEGRRGEGERERGEREGGKDTTEL